MQLWVADFLADTLDLDATEIGAYMLLLMAQWQRNGDSLPMDQVKLQRVARCGRNWPKVWSNIARFFTTDDAGIYSKRLRLEAQNVAAKREVNAQNGALGGIAKALKTKDFGLADATISPQRNASIPEPEPERVKREAKASLQKRGSRLPDDWFLPVAWGEWAVSEGFSENVIREQAERFRDHWHAAPSPRGVKVDWLATWRTWMRNARDRQPQLKEINGGRHDRAQFDSAHREYTRRLAAGQIERGPDPSDPFAGR
jgi:uncharacterized protein YdaU (DUF1376 family)